MHLHYRTIRPRLASPLHSLESSRASSVAKYLEEDDTESLLRQYLNLAPNLSALYEHWSSKDPNFKKRARQFAGIRILKQDAWEALIGFICSSNNNISRISQMVYISSYPAISFLITMKVHNLCLHYGALIGYIDDEPLHDFPTPEALTAPGTEAHLRELGFGYRAGYIAKTALIVAKERPEGWLQALRNPEIFNESKDQEAFPESGREGYRRAHDELLLLQGVGPKVADCVCLMGLGWSESVPVDTHVWQIAQRDYKFGKGKHKSLTKVTYDAVGDHFRALWGREAGWAHSVLFTADLKTFSERLTNNIEVHIDEVRIKQEGEGILESRVVTKREYSLCEVKGELEDVRDGIVLETTRSQRAKRRRT